jgi:putative membrane protein
MLWLKAFHIIFMVCWFAGLFYLPRIFVYHASSEHAETRAQLAIMARKLYRFVTPFLFLTAGFGIALLHLNWDYYQTQVWWWAKFAGVAFLWVYHYQCGRYLTIILEDADWHTHVFYRFFNEIPVLFLFAIVILVVLKPSL